MQLVKIVAILTDDPLKTFFFWRNTPVNRILFSDRSVHCMFI